jgi:hypothetical protein
MKTSGTSAECKAGGPRPKPRQLRYLKDLAVSRGVTFRYPRTRAEASSLIDRLLALPAMSVEDREWEELVEAPPAAVRGGFALGDRG